MYKHYSFSEGDYNNLRNGVHAQIRGVHSTYYGDTYSSSDSGDVLVDNIVYGNTDSNFTNSADTGFSEDIGESFNIDQCEELCGISKNCK